MSDTYRMGSHKLYWHLDRVNAWLDGKRIAPIHIDVGLSKGCNIQCEYCYGMLQGNKYKDGAQQYFPREALLNYMRSAGECGVRSMGFIGEGEPLLNPHIYDAIEEGTKAGIDIALATNGVLFDLGEKGAKALPSLKWIRFNLSAASEEGYRRIHNSPKFNRMLESIKYSVKIKKENKLGVTIGIQMVLTPTNVDQVVALAELGRELGVDYLVVKQCSDTVDNGIGIYKQLGKYASFESVLKEAESKSTAHYNVIIKWAHITNEGKRNYDTCFAPPFLLYSSGTGRLYPCGAFFDFKEEEFRMGDLTTQSFKEIIQSDRYWEVVDKVSKLDVHKVCYSNCRSHAINDFLWMVSRKPEHVNFV